MRTMGTHGAILDLQMVWDWCGTTEVSAQRLALGVFVYMSLFIIPALCTMVSPLLLKYPDLDRTYTATSQLHRLQ